MTAPVISVSAALPPVARKNILRYLGMGRAEEDPSVAALIDACLPEFALAARCQACYMELPVFTKDRVIDFGAMRVESASLAKKLFLEQYPERKIHLIDSKSTGPEMTLLVQKLVELMEQGLSYEEICQRIDAYSETTGLFFIVKSSFSLNNS